MPMYNFDPGEEEEDDWETELLDECYSTHQRRVCKICAFTSAARCRLSGKIKRRLLLQQGYQSMDTEENAELFGGH